MKLNWLIILFFICNSLFAMPQTKRLLNKLDHVTSDTAKVNLLNLIAEEVYFTNPDEIEGYAQQALEISKEIGYKKGIAQAFNNLGIYFRAKSLYSQSIDYHYNSLKIMEELVDSTGTARCYNLIGILYFYLENYDLAEEYLLKALIINEIQNDKKWIAGNTNNLGMIYEKRGNYSKALKYFIESLETNTKMDNQNWIANNYGNIGRLYLNLKNYPLANEYFTKRLAIKESQNDIFGISSSLFLIGLYYQEQGMFEESITPFLQSYILADSIGSLMDIRNATRELSITYSSLKNYEEAFKFHKLNKIYNDSINYQENTQKITRLQLQYQYRKGQQTLEYKYEQTWFLYLIFTLSLLFIILLAVFMYIRQRTITQQHILKEKKLALGNQAMQDELLFKEKQLEDNIIFLVNKNELITDIIEKLVSLKTKLQTENIALINDIISELQSGVTDHIWEEFEVRFNQIHNDFYDNLNIHYPNLTANEKKLCAFLKLNMTSREISAISKQSIKSIESARTRLRKKLRITDSHTNLVIFLNNF